MFTATIARPGCLPESEPAVFETARQAWQFLVGEVEAAWDDHPEDANGACIEAHTQLHNIDQDSPGVIYAPTPGAESTYDLGVAYVVEQNSE